MPVEINFLLIRKMNHGSSLFIFLVLEGIIVIIESVNLWKTDFDIEYISFDI